MYWMAPDIYRRTISGKDFEQTLIVNRRKVFEKDSPDYFPVRIRTLVTAMVDPRPIQESVRQGDRVLTVSNGGVDTPELACLAANSSLCGSGNGSPREVIGAAGHSVAFSNYQPFHGKLLARTLTNAPRLGEGLMTLSVLDVEDLHLPNTRLFKVPHTRLFKVPHSTPERDRLRFAANTEDELFDAVIGSREIVWPQPLDGQEKGKASFFISTDRRGNVREVIPLYTVNERTNDSAVSQLMKWRFKPFTVDGMPAQTEGVLTFDVDTRKWGPSDALSDAEARKLATGVIDPKIAPGSYPSGTVYTLWIAVDTEGKLIEAMAGDGPHELWDPCYESLRKWQLHPIVKDGQALPYRAQIVFKVP